MPGASLLTKAQLVQQIHINLEYASKFTGPDAVIAGDLASLYLAMLAPDEQARIHHARRLLEQQRDLVVP